MAEPAILREHFDVIIVGAGVNGLLTARTFLELQPTLNLIILERSAYVGGVWAKDRVYKGLNLQSAPEYFSLPGMPCDSTFSPPLSFNAKGYLEGTSAYTYFSTWTEKTGLMKYIRLNTNVRQIARHADGKKWECRTGDKILECDKLIITHGIASTPKYPDLDWSTFTPPVMHHRFFGEREKEWDNEDVKTVTIYGGGKGAWDNIVELVKAGKKIKWVIRKEGRGACWILDGTLPSGKKAEVYANSRFFNILMPAMYQDDGYERWHYFFKRNFFGKAFARFFMNHSRQIAIQGMGKMTHNLEKIVGEIGPFWFYQPIGNNNYDIDVFEQFRNGNVEVFRDNIAKMEGREVVLESGERIESDLMIFSTGYRVETSLFDQNPELEMNLGLPTKNPSDEFRNKWKSLETEAEEKVYELNPLLKDAPKAPRPIPDLVEPFRLYHYIIPINFADRSIAFMGLAPTPATVPLAQVSSLWTAAYMFGKLDLPSKEEMEKTTAYELRFSQIRHIGVCQDQPMISFDFMSFLTLLQKDLGLNPYLQPTYLKELFEAYDCRLFDDINLRWMKKEGLIPDKSKNT